MSQDLPVPLPEPDASVVDYGAHGSCLRFGHTDRQMQSYARACMAPLQERADALQAELTRIREFNRILQSQVDSQVFAAGLANKPSDKARINLESALRELIADAERYKTLRNGLYRGDVNAGEAYIVMRVVGACPSREQFDAAIDAQRTKAIK